jgi:hypothetical protein
MPETVKLTGTSWAISKHGGSLTAQLAQTITTLVL